MHMARRVNQAVILLCYSGIVLILGDFAYRTWDMIGWFVDSPTYVAHREIVQGGYPLFIRAITGHTFGDEVISSNLNPAEKCFYSVDDWKATANFSGSEKLFRVSRAQIVLCCLAVFAFSISIYPYCHPVIILLAIQLMSQLQFGIYHGAVTILSEPLSVICIFAEMSFLLFYIRYKRLPLLICASFFGSYAYFIRPHLVFVMLVPLIYIILSDIRCRHISIKPLIAATLMVIVGVSCDPSIRRMTGTEYNRGVFLNTSIYSRAFYFADDADIDAVADSEEHNILIKMLSMPHLSVRTKGEQGLERHYASIVDRAYISNTMKWAEEKPNAVHNLSFLLLKRHWRENLALSAEITAMAMYLAKDAYSSLSMDACAATLYSTPVLQMVVKLNRLIRIEAKYLYPTFVVMLLVYILLKGALWPLVVTLAGAHLLSSLLAGFVIYIMARYLFLTESMLVCAFMIMLGFFLRTVGACILKTSGKMSVEAGSTV